MDHKAGGDPGLLPVRRLSAAGIQERLRVLGYVAEPTTQAVSESSLRSAVQGFQCFHGLTVDGEAGQQTLTAMFHPRHGRCGLPDRIQQANGERCRWPVRDVPVWVGLRLKTLSVERILGAFQRALEEWNQVCGIRLRLTENQSEALIVCEAGRGWEDHFDGAGGTLAWSHLPCGMSLDRLRPLQQKYDVEEPWTVEFLRVVALHELGHALGLDHLPVGNVMAPTYNPAVNRLRADDIREAVVRYGPGPVD